MTKRDRLETENMLRRLAETLAAHAAEKHPSALVANKAREHAESLRRISMTLHRWHEMECGDSDARRAWCVTRGYKDREGFHHKDDGTPFMEIHHYGNPRGNYTHYNAIPDRERGARKRLAAILKRYPGLQAYVQGDPRGAALYILRPGDVPEGETVDSCYSRGIAVYR